MNKLLITLAAGSFFLTARSQQAQVLTAKDYNHAESFMSYNTAQYIDHAPSRPNWISGDRFWFRDLTANGSEFILVNATTGKISTPFDPEKLAAALAAVTGKTFPVVLLYQ